jgi:PAS domain S-box-containing protein
MIVPGIPLFLLARLRPSYSWRRLLRAVSRDWATAFLVPCSFLAGNAMGFSPLGHAVGLMISGLAFLLVLRGLQRHSTEAKTLHDALDASGVGTWSWDVTNDALVWSPQTRTLIGFPPGMLEGGYADFIGRVHPDDRIGITGNLERARDTGMEHRYDYRVIWADGSVRWMSGTGRFLYSTDGAPLRVTGTVFDSTERRLAEEALQRSEEQFRGAIVDAPIPILMLAEDGEILQLSAEWLRLSGYERGQLRTIRDWLMLAHGPDSGDVAAEIDRIFEREEGCRDLELLIRARDGEMRLWTLTASPPGRLGDGRRFLVGMAMDVTERRLAEEALREGQERLSLAIESTDLGTWDYNLASGVLEWSDRAKEMFALPVQVTATYAFFLSRIHPEDRLAVRDALVRAADPEGEGEYRTDFRCLWADGSVRWISALGRARFTEAGEGRQAVRVIGTLLDVTERKRAEEELRRAKEAAEEANRSKDQVLSTLGHELRSPLAPVLALVSAMESDGGLPAELRQKLGVVRRNVELEVRIINDIQDLAAVTAGKLVLRIHATDVAYVLSETLETCRGWAPGELTVELHLDEGDHRIWADSLRLGQAFGTLIENAFRFTPPHETVRIHSRHEGKPPTTLVIEISDSGPGIDPKVLAQLFDPFSRGRLPAGRPAEGVGLRLALARHIVELHGGELTVASGGRGEGATFTVRLPIGQPSADALDAGSPAAEPPEPAADTTEPASSVPAVPEEPASPPRPLNVLMVEDHAETLEWLSKLLANRGYRVSVAGTLKAALATAEAAAAEGQPIDVVLSDLGLPDGSGLSLMHELARRFGVRGIALSGYGLEEDVRKSLAAGFDRHMVKPVRLEDLEAAIRQVTGALKQ